MHIEVHLLNIKIYVPHMSIRTLGMIMWGVANMLGTTALVHTTFKEVTSIDKS